MEKSRKYKKDGLVYTDYFGNILHPSYQAYSYKLYLKDFQLEEFLRMFVGKGNGEDILYQIESSNIKPSKKLIDHVCGLFECNSNSIDG
ncbi:MAG: hypothetical protein IPL53_08445 [Ignavibacteria bacterium]|nr:hypothetical protein [Ignavibacteria bacterium]